MEDMVKIQGYHSCRVDGGWSYILDNAPFISEPNNRQWLTQGYYFWTDSDYFAHKWGQESIKGEYAIVKCLVEVEKIYFLDLVGSVIDQQHFEQLLIRFEQRFQKTGVQSKATVNEVLAFYRKQAEKNASIFPYKAIKAQDKYRKSEIAFIKNKSAAYLPLITRQQLCLFDFNCIKNKDIIYPESFKGK